MASTKTSRHPGVFTGRIRWWEWLIIAGSVIYFYVVLSVLLAQVPMVMPVFVGTIAGSFWGIFIVFTVRVVVKISSSLSKHVDKI
ncbi:MAG: hypothetical protein H6815_03630 [Phycisphaeraceae bacterium]|nr:hypothetical protein [Phycisphaerales bacterium]MCB9859519.1 hypothetical protein [Phycisphaeraceae bacterium]